MVPESLLYNFHRSSKGFFQQEIRAIQKLPLFSQHVHLSTSGPRQVSLTKLLSSLPTCTKKKLSDTPFRISLATSTLIRLSKYRSSQPSICNSGCCSLVSQIGRHRNSSFSCCPNKYASRTPYIQKIPAKLRSKATSFKKTILQRIFFLKSGWSNQDHKVINGSIVGFIKVIYNLCNTHLTLKCYDHDQYPWSSHPNHGTMAVICIQHSVNNSSCNNCLPLHLIMGLLHHRLIPLTTILAKYRGL